MSKLPEAMRGPSAAIDNSSYEHPSANTARSRECFDHKLAKQIRRRRGASYSRDMEPRAFRLFVHDGDANSVLFLWRLFDSF